MIISIIFFVKIKRIKSSNEIKLPGITIDSKLAFANHGNKIYVVWQVSTSKLRQNS